MRGARVWAAVMLAWVMSAPVWAQLKPAGGEFQINTYTTGNQSRDMDSPAVCSDRAGNFVVVWTSTDQDGDNNGVFGQRYSSSGMPSGTEFQVNTYTIGQQAHPSINCDASGNFVVAWQSFDQDGDGWGVFSQRYNSAGVAQGNEFQVNTYTTDDQSYPALSCDSTGNFVVVWESYAQDSNNSNGIFSQRYNSTGAAQGNEFQVNTYTTGEQRYPAIASDANGNFVVAWESKDQDGDNYGIFAQRYDNTATKRGTEFQVNTYTTNFQYTAAVASDKAGNFVVAWESYKQDGDEQGVFAQRYDSSGVKQGSEFQVNQYTTAAQDDVALAFDGAGNFVVVWESKQDGNNDGVFTRRYSKTGTALTNEFQVNTYTTNQQENAAVSSNPAGDLAVVWGSVNQDGDMRGVFGQLFKLLPPGAQAPAVGPVGLGLIGGGLLLTGVLAVNLRRRKRGA